MTAMFCQASKKHQERCDNVRTKGSLVTDHHEPTRLSAAFQSYDLLPNIRVTPELLTTRQQLYACRIPAFSE